MHHDCEMVTNPFMGTHEPIVLNPILNPRGSSNTLIQALPKEELFLILPCQRTVMESETMRGVMRGVTIPPTLSGIPNITGAIWAEDHSPTHDIEEGVNLVFGRDIHFSM